MRIRMTIIHDGKEFQGDAELTEVGRGRRVSQAQPKIATQAPSSPAEAIRSLFEKGFFRETRGQRDVAKKLKEQGYNFGSSSITMALQRARFLHQRGSKGTYSYVQKIPPTAVES